jgi:RNA polymerase sigma factor (sigma-70 family)
MRPGRHRPVLARSSGGENGSCRRPAEPAAGSDVETERLVVAARAGDLSAFGELVGRYQHMAVAYAFSLLRDLDLAQDATQEAFVAAYLALDALNEPLAFPGWLRAVVRTQCGRLTRRRRLPAVPLGEAWAVADEHGAPEARVERREASAHMLAALAGLARPHREILTLHYVNDYSHREIADFLGIPPTTVNARLHAARVALRDRVLGMVRQALRAGAVPQDFPTRVARAIEDWRRVREAERFDVWPSLRPFAPLGPIAAGSLGPAAPRPLGFRPHHDPACCGCRRLAWPCPRCARIEGVDDVPPLA